MKKISLNLGYFGGKSNQSSFMNTFIPKRIQTYTEVFGGSFKNYIYRDFQAQKVVYNDYSYLMFNLMSAFKYPQTFLKAFRKQVWKGSLAIPCSFTAENKDRLKDHYETIYIDWRQKFLNLNKNSRPATINWEYAVMYAFCLIHSRNNIPLGRRFEYNKDVRSALPSFIGFLKNLRKRNNDIKQLFGKVMFHNQNACEILKQYDCPEAFHLIDPPYIEHEFYYQYQDFRLAKESDYKFHEELAKTLKVLEGKWMLCYYYHPMLENLYPRDKYTWITKSYHRGCGGGKGCEIFILNYKLDKIQKDVLYQHYKGEIQQYLPARTGRSKRYSVGAKRIVLDMLSSGIFTKKEVMSICGVKCYSTLNQWAKKMKIINNALYLSCRAFTLRSKNRKESNLMLVKLYNLLQHRIGIKKSDILKKFNISDKDLMALVKGTR